VRRESKILDSIRFDLTWSVRNKDSGINGHADYNHRPTEDGRVTTEIGHESSPKVF